MLIADRLRHIEKIRIFWNAIADPGIGLFDIGHGYTLRVSEHEAKKGKSKHSYIIKLGDIPLTMSDEWELFDRNLRKKETINMSKMSINDNDLREKIRLKCKNDWDIELNEDQVSMCIIEMQEQKLSLFHNQIWPNRRKYKKKNIIDEKSGTYEWVQCERITWDKSIDGYRAIAHRSGRFAGIDAAEFSIDDENQLLARVIVYVLDRDGNRCPYIGEARYSEFVQSVDEWKGGKVVGKKPNNQWAESPRNQLSIAAERQALRKAFQDWPDDSDVPVVDVRSAEPDLGIPAGNDEVVSQPVTAAVKLAEPEAAAPPITAQKRQPTKAAKLPPPKGLASKPEGEEMAQTAAVGKYVGTPLSGYKPGMKYNAEERIAMCAQSKTGWVLALDNGKRVKVNNGGFEVERVDRSDKNPGGSTWKPGDTYDGAAVEKVAQSKNDEWSLWLALDNGFKVCLDRWGKETKKKPRQQEKDTPAPASTVIKATEAALATLDEYEVAKAAKVALKKNGSDLTASPATPSEPTIENISDIEMVRKLAGEVLKKWCSSVAGQRMSYKEAYQKLTGVVIPKGQAMTLDDYKVLYDELGDALKQAGE